MLHMLLMIKMELESHNAIFFSACHSLYTSLDNSR